MSVVTYTYDLLYRLTRTRYTETITSATVTAYTYGAANRLTNVDGVAYT